MSPTEEYVKIVRKKTSFELAMYFGLDMLSCNSGRQIRGLGSAERAALFIAPLFTVGVSDLGVMEMEQA